MFNKKDELKGLDAAKADIERLSRKFSENGMNTLKYLISKEEIYHGYWKRCASTDKRGRRHVGYKCSNCGKICVATRKHCPECGNCKVDEAANTIVVKD